MATLETVQDYIDRARSLLQDRQPPYRYSDEDMTEALNLAILEARRIRPDMMRSFFRNDLPQYDAGAPSTPVDVEQMYRPAFVYYIVGHMQLRDEEEVTDARAASFLNKFVAQLLTTQA